MSYWVNNISVGDVHNMVFARLCKGRELEKFVYHGHNFLAERLSQMLYSPAINELQKWKEAGVKILLLSSAPDYLVKAVAKILGICDGYGSEYLVDSKGILTDLGPLLDGSRKAAFIKEKIGSDGVTVGYSDHVCDLPFLESVSHPVVVNPERRLKKIARRRGWKIL